MSYRLCVDEGCKARGLKIGGVDNIPGKQLVQEKCLSTLDWLARKFGKFT